MANTSIGRQTGSSEWLVREVAGSRGAAGGQQGGDIDWPWEVFFCCVVRVSAITDDICDDVLDMVEGIAGETVIELTQEETGIKEINDSDKKCIHKKESERCDT
jgi:hypothetical protein